MGQVLLDPGLCKKVPNIFYSFDHTLYVLQILHSGRQMYIL
jgi:hypothetical protein